MKDEKQEVNSFVNRRVALFKRPDQKVLSTQGGAVARSVERATSGEEVLSLIPAVTARSPTGWVGVCVLWPAETEVMVSPLCLVCGST